MAEDNQDSGLETGTQGAPTPAGSQGQGVQPGSGDVAKLQQTLDAITSHLKELDARTKSLQGDKDRGVNATRKEVADLKRQIAEVEKLRGTGLDPEQAIEEFAFREDIREIKERLNTLNEVPAQPAGNGPIGVAEATRLVTKYGVDPKEPDVAAALNSGGDVEGKLAKLAFAKINAPSPTPAQQPVVQGRPVPPPDVEQQTQEYMKEMKATQGKSGGPSAARAIREKYKKLGVPVDSVVFE